MNLGKLTSRITRPWLSGGIAAALTALLGMVLFLCTVGRDLTRLSYDFPFLVRSEMAAPDVVMVFLDEASHAQLEQPTAAPWDRSLHARLIDRLTADGARAIAFDILFTDASDNPAADAALARSIELSRRVVLGANLNRYETEQGVLTGEELPYDRFRTVAAAWGNVNFLPDPDYGVRSFFGNLHDIAGQTNILWLPWAVARFASPSSRIRFPSLSTEPRLNFYGPPGAIPHVSYSQALLPDGVAPGLFKDKIVFVGSKMSAGLSGQNRDNFRVPYTYWSKELMPGVEVHATATLNLLHGNWLTRFPFVVEMLLVLLVAVGAGFGLMRLQPLVATGAALLALGAIPCLAVFIVWRHLYWFSWLVLMVQVAAAWLSSIVFNSLTLYVDKHVLEHSLGAHLSPKLVKRMVKEPALRQLGGLKQEVSILFTDIANFSRISETMPPDELVRLLNRYFEITIGCVRDADGTVIKLIGDAIFAVWNAPIEQPDYRERACQAALRLREQLVDFESDQNRLPLRTRVGLHAGTAASATSAASPGSITPLWVRTSTWHPGSRDSTNMSALQFTGFRRNPARLGKGRGVAPGRPFYPLGHEPAHRGLRTHRPPGFRQSFQILARQVRRSPPRFPAAPVRCRRRQIPRSHSLAPDGRTRVPHRRGPCDRRWPVPVLPGQD